MWVFDLVNQFILLLDWLFDAFSWAVPTFKFGFMIISIFATALNSAVLIKVILEFIIWIFFLCLWYYHRIHMESLCEVSQNWQTLLFFLSTLCARSLQINELCCLSWWCASLFLFGYLAYMHVTFGAPHLYACFGQIGFLFQLLLVPLLLLCMQERHIFGVK